MHRLFSILLAAVILYAAPIVATPMPQKSIGGHSVHYKTVGEGKWPYRQVHPEGQLRNVGITLPGGSEGYWI
jgi:hypothetical protein